MSEVYGPSFPAHFHNLFILFSLSSRMSMRSLVSPQLELNGAGNMVNCTVKTEDKNESHYKLTQGEAPCTSPVSNSPSKSPVPLGDFVDPLILPQVGHLLSGMCVHEAYLVTPKGPGHF